MKSGMNVVGDVWAEIMHRTNGLGGGGIHNAGKNALRKMRGVA